MVEVETYAHLKRETEDNLKSCIQSKTQLPTHYKKDYRNAQSRNIDLSEQRVSSFKTHKDDQGTDSNPHPVLQASHMV
jgi:t-SNARE complex subunit (syntaxin)